MKVTVAAMLACTTLVLGCSPSRPAAVSPAMPTVAVGDAFDTASLVITAPGRSEEDRRLDGGRQPAETLWFFEIRQGMRVGELGAGGGYTSELLARSVGPGGAVYGHNSPFLLDRFAQAPWSERLKKPEMSNVTRLDRELDDPFTADVGELDAVLIVLFYHDAVWMNVDRDRMNKAVFAALKPGGIYGVIDHSSWPGRGLSEVQTLHRIDEQLVREEIERAGFELADQAFFLRNTEDSRDWNAAPNAAGELRGTSDRFVLKFVKPANAPPAATP